MDADRQNVSIRDVEYYLVLKRKEILTCYNMDKP